MTVVVFLVRHAAHPDLGRRLTGRRAGVLLSEAGEQQARAVAERLGGEALSAVYSSPRERALATAEAIAQTAGLRSEVAPGLDELDFGDWTGCRFEDLAGDPLWREWNEARATACPPNGETMASATARIVEEIERLAGAHRQRAHREGAVALVSHCDMIRGAVAHYLGLPLDHLLRFDIDPASISRLHLGPWGARIVGLNEQVPPARS